MGIDLGTTNSCLAYSDANGNVKAFTGKNGKDIVPSVVLFTENGKMVGHEAKQKRDQYNTSSSASFFKRQMGTKITRTMRSVEYTPTELSALVITKMVSEFESEMNFKVRKAVITVPGDYSDAERSATIEAARIAGIEEVELLNEPVAAALSYGIGKGDKKDTTFIVYDLGGGTFDATVLKLENEKFTVLSSEGSKNLGGRDWDLELATIIQKKILDSTGLTFADIESDSDFRKAVMDEAELQKEQLSYNDRVVSKVDLRGNPVVFSTSREELEEATTWLISTTIDMVGYALRNANLQMNSLDKIILIGGSTLMPQVLRSLEDAYPSTDIQFFDPEHSVAKGAAIYAESVFGKKDIHITTVLTKSIGILAGIDGVEKICNILFRNTPLPIENTLMCRPKKDDQNVLDIAIYETYAKRGEEFVDVEEGNLIFKTSVELTGKISRGRTKIAVRFSADREGKITAVVECNGKMYPCDLSDRMILSNEEIINSRVKMRGVI